MRYSLCNIDTNQDDLKCVGEDFFLNAGIKAGERKGMRMHCTPNGVEGLCLRKISEITAETSSTPKIWVYIIAVTLCYSLIFCQSKSFKWI